MPTRVSLYMKPDDMPSNFGTNSIRNDSSDSTMIGIYADFMGSDFNSYPCGRNYVGINGSKAVRYCSNYVSNSECVFENVPWVRFTMENSITSKGATVFYRGAWLKPHKVRVTWLDASDNQLSQKEFTDDSYSPEGIQGGESTYQFYENYVENWKKLKVEFLESWLPNQSIYLVDVSTSDVAVFDSDVVMSAECDIINRGCSDELEIGTATVTISDPNGQFNPQNIGGRWVDLGENESVVLCEYDDNNDILLETFWYIDTFDWENDVLTLNLVDCIGYLDKCFFPGVDYDSHWYAPTMYDIFWQMHNFTQLRASYPGIDWTFTFEQFTMGNGTCKEYLQNVMFAIGGEVRRHFRRHYYATYSPLSSVKLAFHPDRKFNTRLTFDEAVNGVNIEIPTSREYEQTASVFKEQYFDVGKYLVTFDDGYTDITITGATDITGSIQNNYRKIRVDTAGTVTFSGKRVSANFSTYSEQIIKGTDETTFKDFKVLARCSARQENMFSVVRKYYSNRQVLNIDAKFNFVGGDANKRWTDSVNDLPGKWCVVTDTQGLTAYARLEKVHVDLVGGMIGNCELRGYSRQVVDKFRMVEDDYTMEDNPLM